MFVIIWLSLLRGLPLVAKIYKNQNKTKWIQQQVACFEAEYSELSQIPKAIALLDYLNERCSSG